MSSFPLPPLMKAKNKIWCGISSGVYTVCTSVNLCQEKVLLLTKQLKDYEHCWNAVFKLCMDASSNASAKISLVGGFPMDSLAKSGFPLLIGIWV